MKELKLKYVAFLDILGFKNKLRDLKQNRARSFISNFSKTIFNIFNSQNFGDKINGYIVSDSLILYSNDIKRESLHNLIELIREVCETEFASGSIAILAGVVKPEKR